MPLVLSDENASDKTAHKSLSSGGDFAGMRCGCDLSQWLVLSSLMRDVVMPPLLFQNASCP
jgi:hypothetical protein